MDHDVCASMSLFPTLWLLATINQPPLNFASSGNGHARASSPTAAVPPTKINCRLHAAS